MKTTKNTKFATLILSTLILSMLLCTGCSKNSLTLDSAPESSASVSLESIASDVSPESSAENAVTLKTFTFTVIDGDGNETVFDIETGKETVGDALLEQGLIVGEEGPYGLYVKTVNGITADYETTGTYWAFYINGEYGMTGVDTTPITEGEVYSFKVEKA